MWRPDARYLEKCKERGVCESRSAHTREEGGDTLTPRSSATSWSPPLRPLIARIIVFMSKLTGNHLCSFSKKASSVVGRDSAVRSLMK